MKAAPDVMKSRRGVMLSKIAAMLPRSCLEQVAGVEVRPHMMLRPYLQDIVVRRFPEELRAKAKEWIDSIPCEGGP